MSDQVNMELFALYDFTTTAKNVSKALTGITMDRAARHITVARMVSMHGTHNLSSRSCLCHAIASGWKRNTSGKLLCNKFYGVIFRGGPINAQSSRRSYVCVS